VESDQGAAGEAAVCIAMKDGTPFGIAGIWENWNKCHAVLFHHAVHVGNRRDRSAIFR
jgi:hypothetical protein